MDAQSSDLYQKALAVPLQSLQWSVAKRHNIELLVRRDDQIDGLLSGNKYYKLYFNIAAAKAAGFAQVASFGGAYSNHLHALAAAGRKYEIATVGLVRGERPAVLSPTLQDAEAWGMTLYFLPREVYRTAQASLTNDFLNAEFGRTYRIPEGGANEAGCRGAMAIGQAIEEQLEGAYQQVCLPCGTGATLAGVAAGLPCNKIALGFSVLKGVGDLGADIDRAYRRVLAPAGEMKSAANWRLLTGFHGGGYGKKLPPSLCCFWREFELETGLLLDPVYTLKMFWGIACLAEAGYWRKRARLVVVHTGGLQGRRGFQQQIDW